MRWTLNLCVVPGLVATLTLSPAAFAEEAIDLDAVENPTSPQSGTAVMVPTFQGARAKTIRARFVTALEKSGMSLIPQSAAGNTKLGSDPANYIFVAQGNGVQAFVNGKVKLTVKRWTLTIEVRSGANGTVVGTDTISSGWLPGLLKAIDKEARPKVDALLEKAGASAVGGVGAEKVELVPPDDSASATSIDPSTADPSLTAADQPERNERALANEVPTPLVLSAGGGLILRNLSYTDAYLDTLRQQLYPHGIGLMGFKLGAMWYPGAHVTDGVLANIGLNVHFIRSVGGKTNVGEDKVPSQAGAPTSYPTIFEELDLGLRGRIPMGSWEMGLNLGWGKQKLGLQGDNHVVRLPYSNSDEEYPGVVPDVDIEYYRFGADVGFQLFSWSWTIGAGMRTPFYSREPGQIADERWFPNVIGTTATANLGVNIPLFSQLGLAVNADFRQTGMDMNTSPNAVVPANNDDPEQNLLQNSVAGGATDRQILVMAALTWSFGEPSSGAADSSDSNDEEDQPSSDSSEETSSDEAEEQESTTADAEASPPPAARDTSDPSFFGAGAASTKPRAKAQHPSAQKDTSNPDFFK